MFSWLSDHRASIAAILIAVALVAFVWSIVVGRRESKRREKDEVFGDPERNKNGWYWAVCGVSALFLVWSYYSWGVARAYFPRAANELCQVAKLDEGLSPITTTLPLFERYMKSTDLVARNVEQIDELEGQVPWSAFGEADAQLVRDSFEDIRGLLAAQSKPELMAAESATALADIRTRLDELATRLRSANLSDFSVPPEALEQSKWGVSFTEIPLLPETPRGVLFDRVSQEAAGIADDYRKIRNRPQVSLDLIEAVSARLDTLDAGSSADAGMKEQRDDFLKSLRRIYRRLDDGTIFPAAALDGIDAAVANIQVASREAQGGLVWVDRLFVPSGEIVKSRTQCSEQGTGRWLPKPTDVVAKFGQLANPNLDEGGGYKGTRLLWWKWLAVSDIVGFFLPDWIADLMPGEYARHADDGTVTLGFKDKVLALAQGKVDLGYIPMLDGHIWDSLFRVLVAMAFGILLGVPLGIMMGVSRFYKSFFDPLIELYRPVPPLAWAPLILTIFGIQDDGKIFLLFMVAFAIMVISARTGASGTQLTKIRASHSLGASNSQILRHVILPNALPEILTGIRISIGVCWGTLVAAEMLAGTTGVGFIENVARTVSDYELIWVTILIMGILGLVFDIAMRWVINKTIPWRGKG